MYRKSPELQLWLQIYTHAWNHGLGGCRHKCYFGPFHSHIPAATGINQSWAKATVTTKICYTFSESDSLGTIQVISIRCIPSNTSLTKKCGKPGLWLTIQLPVLGFLHCIMQRLTSRASPTSSEVSCLGRLHINHKSIGTSKARVIHSKVRCTIIWRRVLYKLASRRMLVWNINYVALNFKSNDRMAKKWIRELSKKLKIMCHLTLVITWTNLYSRYIVRDGMNWYHTLDSCYLSMYTHQIHVNKFQMHSQNTHLRKVEGCDIRFCLPLPGSSSNRIFMPSSTHCEKVFTTTFSLQTFTNSFSKQKSGKIDAFEAASENWVPYQFHLAAQHE